MTDQRPTSVAKFVPPGLIARAADVYRDEIAWAFNMEPQGADYLVTVFANGEQLWSGVLSRAQISDAHEEPGVSFSAEMDTFIAEVRIHGREPRPRPQPPRGPRRER